MPGQPLPRASMQLPAWPRYLHSRAHGCAVHQLVAHAGQLGAVHDAPAEVGRHGHNGVASCVPAQARPPRGFLFAAEIGGPGVSGKAAQCHWQPSTGTWQRWHMVGALSAAASSRSAARQAGSRAHSLSVGGMGQHRHPVWCLEDVRHRRIHVPLPAHCLDVLHGRRRARTGMPQVAGSELLL